MGKSSSFFKLIACSSDPSGNDENDLLEARASIDRRGWSFRKRSGRHRVLNNVVSTVMPSSTSKDGSESTVNSRNPANVEENVCISEEETHPLSSIHSEMAQTVVSTFADERNPKPHHEEIEEAIAIVIQNAIRVLLAREKLLTLKKLVKLQASVRGHLVRRHAVGALYCIESIVKIQTIVRTNRRKFHNKEHPAQYFLADSKISNNVANNRSSNQRVLRSSRLMRNGFARQLLESAPSRKNLHFECDYSKPSSVLTWLERWTRVVSPLADSGMKESKPVEGKEAKKLTSGSKKTSNPAFIAAQLKFQELVAVNSYKPTSNENAKTRVAGSECGTEISVTSAFDSPDKSEVVDYGDQVEVVSRVGCSSSPETITESHGNTASEASVNTKRNKVMKNGASQRRRSISNSGHDLEGRNSIEKWGGSYKTGHVDPDPRNSSSSSSIPSYMQPTESARAKLYASNSPRSSPDIQGKEVLSRKRHSMPGANGRHGSGSGRISGRIHHDPNPHTPQERKWQR